MSNYRFLPVPSNGSIAAGVTIAVCAWFALASGSILVDRAPAHADGVQHAVLMEEAAPASPTPLPVAALSLAAQPVACEKIVVEASRSSLS